MCVWNKLLQKKKQFQFEIKQILHNFQVRKLIREVINSLQAEELAKASTSLQKLIINIEFYF